MSVAVNRTVRAAQHRGGFTLLEVLVAISILGLGLTAILSAQTGLFASSTYAERVSVGVGLVRCKMSEIELKLQRDGYPLIDTQEEGPCCADEANGGYSCRWKVEKVELPPPPESGDLGSGPASNSGAPGMGAFAQIAAVGQSNGATLGDTPGMGDVAKLLGGSGSSGGDQSAAMGAAMGGTSTMAPMVMSLVYPTLKPMLEASIRKLTVAVFWKDGSRERDLTVQQFVTNPQQGGLDPNASQGLEGAANLLQNQFLPPPPVGKP